ncbi:SET domain protein, partial [Cooperia oncophora]
GSQLSNDKRIQEGDDSINAESSSKVPEEGGVLKKKKKKLGGSDKVREKKRIAAEQARNEAILNQRGNEDLITGLTTDILQKLYWFLQLVLEGVPMGCPGHKGFGVRALREIPKGVFICEYAGEVLNKDEVERRAVSTHDHNYTLTIREHGEEGIVTTFFDPRHRGNLARFINHACEPNLSIVIVRIGYTVPHVGLFSNRVIQAGEEICYDYGTSALSLESGKECLCGFPSCRKVSANRIPTKNRKKLKSVDPFNKKAPALKAEAMSEVRRRQSNDKKELKRRKQRKSKVLAEAEKIGIRKGRFETIPHFVRRVERMTYAAVKDHEMLVKQGLAGRDESEIAADFKLLEEKEKRRKEQKKNEIQNKIKAAREKREREAKIKEERLKEKEERKTKRKAEALGDQDMVEVTLEKDEEGDDSINAESSQVTEEGGVLKKKKKKLGGSDKVREKKRIAAEQARNEAILNQREVIAFGERYDAPPEFKGAMKKEMNPLMAKAGAKKLLLHSLLQQNSSSSKTKYLEDDKREKPGELDRLRVIEAYREMKRKRRMPME